jgi:hypothetical protein
VTCRDRNESVREWDLGVAAGLSEDDDSSWMIAEDCGRSMSSAASGGAGGGRGDDRHRLMDVWDLSRLLPLLGSRSWALG